VTATITDSGGATDYADATPQRAPGLYEGIVRGRRFVHDPAGHDALAVLSARAARLLDAADGRSLGEIARDTGESLGALSAELALLARNGFVTGAGLPTPRRPPATRSFSVWIHVTNACNLECPYCYVAKDGHALSEETARTLREALVTTVRRSNVTRVHVTFGGGEPMLRFGFVRRFFEETREALRAAGAELSAAILTNGTVLPDGAVEWLREHRVSVSVSLDGVGACHDAMRPAVGGAGSFERVLLGLERLSAGGVRPYVLTTVSAANLAGLPALTDFMLDRALGFRYSLVRDLGAARLGRREPAGATLEGDALRGVQDVLGECYARIESRIRTTPSFRRTHRFCDLELRRPIERACGAGERQVAVSDRGLLSPCQAAFAGEVGAPLAGDASLVDVAPTLAPLAARRRATDDACARCAHRRSCAGGCPLLLLGRDGHVGGRSPYCEVFRYVIPRILRISALELLLDAERRAARRA
jgi:uncharacterized protein